LGKNDPPDRGSDESSLGPGYDLDCKIQFNDDFGNPLAGLTHELNYRIHELLWCEVSVLLDNGILVGGTIVFVGSNFIEMRLPTKHYKEHSKDSEYSISRTLLFPIAKIVCIESDSSCHPE